MKTRSRKRAREASISQEHSPAESQIPVSVENHSSDGEKDAPFQQKPRAKRSRPSMKESTTAANDPAQPEVPHDASPESAAANKEGDASSPPPETLRRTTRAQNKLRHPALDVGLDWQVAKREREAAEAARAEKQDQEARKKAEKDERTHLRRAGIARIAELEIEREQRDREEDETTGAGSGTARGYRASPKARSTRQFSTGAAEARESGTGPDFTGDEYSTSERSEGDDEDKDLRIEPVRAKKKTKAELKRDRRVKLHDEISTARDAVAAKAKKPASGPAEKRQSGAAGAAALMPRSAPQSTPVRTSGAPRAPLLADDEDAFRPGYKAKFLDQVASKSRSLATPISSSRPSTPTNVPAPRQHGAPTGRSTPKPSAPRIRPAGTPVPALHQPPPNHSDDENEFGGLDDDDVDISRNFVNRSSTGRSSQNLQVTYVQPEPLPKLKMKRTRKVDMNPEKSLSAELLEDWICPTFDTVLMPTLLDHYGAEEDFWTLDEKTANKRQATTNNVARRDSEKRYLPVDVMQDIIDSLYPREFRRLQQTDLVVRVARQRILNWRRGFYERAIKVVKAGYEDYKAKNPDATKADLKKWVSEALDPDAGCAFWEKPPSRRDPAPHGNFQSIYVLTTFSPHLGLTANSHYEEHHPPIGAFSLALAAVEFTFSTYDTGVYVDPGKKKFDQQGVGHISDWYLADAVLPALQKKDLWSIVMKRAAEFNDQAAPSANVESLAPSRQRRPRRRLDSSPTRPDSE